MLKTDNIENSEKYIEAMIEIKPILEKEFENQFGMGICHRYWHRKKRVIKKLWHRLEISEGDESRC